jgi:threonine dehydrogenase-like Zn-dependent dehydrogenase
MGQAHVRRWSDDILPLLTDTEDPLGCAEFATHRLTLGDAAAGYELFRDKRDGCVKVVLTP